MDAPKDAVGAPTRVAKDAVGGPTRGVEPGYASWLIGSFVNVVIHDGGATFFPDWRMDAGAAAVLFQRAWVAEVAAPSARAKSGARATPSLSRAIWRAFSRQFLLAALLKLLWAALVLFGVVYFVRELLSYVRSRAADGDVTAAEYGVGIGLSCGFLVTMVLQSVMLQQMSIISARLGLRVEAAVSAAIFGKELSYDRTARVVDTTSLIANDCAKLGEACTMLQYLWSGAVEALAIMAILIVLVGRAALPGLGVVLLLVPLQVWVGTATSHARTGAIAAADVRVGLTDEVLRSIKLVKMYVWEKSFATQVAIERRKEVAVLFSGGTLKSFNFAIVFVTPPLIALSIFGVQALESPLEAALAFTTLSLFNTLRLPLVQLPKALRATIEAITSAQRIAAFLLLPDRVEAAPTAAPTVAPVGAESKTAPEGVTVEVVTSPEEGVVAAPPSAAAPPSSIAAGAVEFSDASFAFGAASPPLLRNVTLSLRPGSVTMVTGGVAAGKSNLLLAALGQMTCVSGTVAAGGAFSYVPQTPWCARGTVRENIVFGSPWDEERYRRVLFACALERDMELFDDGDLTMLGERGMNLSGGQRQRIAIARAVYARAHVAFLDAPLSAVDAYTSQHLFRHALRGILGAEGCTVVLVTHQVELLPFADTLVVLEDGAVAYAGPPAPDVVDRFFPGREIAAGTSSAADAVLTALAQGAGPSGVKGSPAGRRSPRSSPRLGPPPAQLPPPLQLMSKEELLTKTLSVRRDVMRSVTLGSADEVLEGGVTVSGSASQTPSSRSRSNTVTAVRVLTTTATSHRYPLSPAPAAAPAGDAADAAASSAAAPAPSAPAAATPPSSENSYLGLARALRWHRLLPVVGIFIGTQLTRIYSDIWISVWVSKAYPSRSENWYVGVYGGYVAAFLVLLFLRGIVFVAMFFDAFTRLHDAMLSAILAAPLSFFSKTPLGSIISVVSKDMDNISDALVDSMYLSLVYLMILGTTIGVIVTVVRVFLAVVGCLVVVFVLLVWRYIVASNVLKSRVGDTSMSVCAAASEAAQGASVLQAFRAESRYRARFSEHLLASQSAQFTFETLQLWLTVRADLIGVLMVFATCVMCVMERSLPPAAAGLAISNSFQILLFLSLMVRTAASAHGSISGVDRVRALGNVAPEEVPGVGERPPARWPARGEVDFLGVSMSYLPSAPHVLKGVTFRVRAGEKVGIVGRTGAGKSSLIQALFRLAAPIKGAIRIDGVDIAQLGLAELRRKIAILPQEPVMYRGTLRSNLDPFCERTDEELLHALDLCLLRSLADAHPAGLKQPVESLGRNFSLGQQQLVCLARAFLNDSRLLLLDEATAALDAATDAKVQAVLRSVFSSRTILTIAHRIDTIIDSDRVLVLDAGSVAEFASPAELLRDEGSIFSQLCRQLGSVNHEGLRAAAERNEELLGVLSEEVRAAEEARIRTGVGLSASLPGVASQAPRD